MNWTEELKKKAIELYQSMEPTPQTTIECVKDVAEQIGEGVTANGIRAILSKAEVYVAAGKAVAGAKAGASKSGEDKPARVSKESAVGELVAAINDFGIEPDMEIISKLTGKAAIYFAEVIRTAQSK